MKNTNGHTLANAAMVIALLSAIALPLAVADPKPVDNAKADKTNPTDKNTEGGEPSIDDLLKLTKPKKGDGSKTPNPKTKLKIDESKGLTTEQAADAFVVAVEEMKQAASRLGGYQDAGLKTQRLQESILRRLDQVIKAKKNQKQNQSNSGSGSKKQETGSKQNQQKQKQGQQKSKGGTSANKSRFSPGDNDTKAAVGGAIEESRIEWGQLPARLRTELEQGIGEQFSPLYQKLTEAYYKRLAEEGKE